jgi:hypothetical protein
MPRLPTGFALPPPTPHSGAFGISGVGIVVLILSICAASLLYEAASPLTLELVDAASAKQPAAVLRQDEGELPGFRELIDARAGAPQTTGGPAERDVRNRARTIHDRAPGLPACFYNPQEVRFWLR